jgi:hypothetical protein
MTNKVLILPVTFEGLQSRVDKSLKVTIVTSEVTPDVAGALFEMQRGFGYVAIKPVEFEAQEREMLEALETDFVDDKKKTPSQMLRAVLYLNWKEDNRGFAEFKAFYRNEMTRIIDQYRAKIS